MKPDTLVTAWAPILGPVIASLIAISGWIAAHRFSAGRDTANRLRSLRVKELLEVYRSLDSASGGEVDDVACRAIERAVSDLQVLGTDHVVAQAQELARSFEGSHSGSLTIEDLLQTLRANIRRDLGLSARNERTLRLKLTYQPSAPELPEEWEHVEISDE